MPEVVRHHGGQIGLGERCVEPRLRPALFRTAVMRRMPDFAVYSGLQLGALRASGTRTPPITKYREGVAPGVASCVESLQQ